MCFFLSFKKNSNCRRVIQKLWPLWIMLRFVSNQVVILLLFLRLIKVFYFPVYWLSELIENATNSSIAEFFKTHSTCKNCVQKQLNSWFIFILFTRKPNICNFFSMLYFVFSVWPWLVFFKICIRGSRSIHVQKNNTCFNDMLTCIILKTFILLTKPNRRSYIVRKEITLTLLKT